ncbi:MAG: GIY-YIG nuclease family protein, partial [Thermoprotei archaeon]
MVRGDSGVYQLVIRLDRECAITIGRLGRFVFPAGYYVYTGSAKKGLEARVSRHLREDKKLKWHIDYFLKHARVVEVKKYCDGQGECELNLAL